MYLTSPSAESHKLRAICFLGASNLRNVNQKPEVKYPVTVKFDRVNFSQLALPMFSALRL